jgi:hypothetical protein
MHSYSLIVLLSCVVTAATDCQIDENDSKHLMCSGSINQRDLDTNPNIRSMTLFDPEFVCNEPLTLNHLPRLFHISTSTPSSCRCLCSRALVPSGNCLTVYCEEPVTPARLGNSSSTPLRNITKNDVSTGADLPPPTAGKEKPSGYWVYTGREGRQCTTNIRYYKYSLFLRISQHFFTQKTIPKHQLAATTASANYTRARSKPTPTGPLTITNSGMYPRQPPSSKTTTSTSWYHFNIRTISQ